MSLCPNCGNPWLESYEAAGKCDACGHVVSAGEPHVMIVETEPDPEV